MDKCYDEVHGNNFCMDPLARGLWILQTKF